MEILGMTMVNFLRSVVTVLAFVSFIGIALWAWSGARRANFAAAARIPFEDDELDREAGLQASPHAERSSK
jgi:cytochrome c oxidase cbb3-type subunit 4